MQFIIIQTLNKENQNVGAGETPKHFLEDIMEKLKLEEQKPRLVLSVTGGAKLFSLKSKYSTCFTRGLMKIATTIGNKKYYCDCFNAGIK